MAGVKSGGVCWGLWGAIVLGGPLYVSCDFAAIKQCHSEMEGSQKAMLEMDSEEIEQVKSALAAVVRTHEACVAAGRSDEVSKVADAKRKLEAQVRALEERAGRKKRPKLSEAELAALEKKGDPSCPKGQQYEHHQNNKLISCTGKQIVEMNAAEATEYLERRGFTLRSAPPLLRFEKGAESYDFHFEKENDPKAASCVSVVAAMGIAWEETVARLSGVHPQKLKLGSPVPVQSGARVLRVEGDQQQFTVKLGACSPTPGQKAYDAPQDP